jgi:hypothetical protein
MRSPGDSGPPNGHGWHSRRSVKMLGALIVLCGLVAALLLIRHHRDQDSRQVGVQAAQLGTRRFNRASNACHLRPRVARHTPQLLFGVSAGLRFYTGRALCEEARLAQATGVQSVREDLVWADIEPRPGEFRWSSFDRVVQTAADAGLTVLPIIDDPPQWAAATETTVPADPAAYATFVAAAVRRYGPGGRFWSSHRAIAHQAPVWFELWNEPYYAAGGVDPGRYARLVRAAVIAGRAANPRTRFLIEATLNYQTPYGQTANWVERMYHAVPDLGDFFDGVAVHPYGGNPELYTPHGDTTYEPGRIAQIHAAFAAHGDGDKPFWVTEIGWSTCQGNDTCVTESEQAQYLKSFIMLSETSWASYVRAVYVFGLRDLAPGARDNPQNWYGLLRPDLTRKPAWYVLHDFATS